MRVILTLFFLLPVILHAQKTPIDHTVYDDWKEVKSTVFSKDGRYVAFEIEPGVGDSWLHWVNTETMQRDSVLRGKDPVFDPLNAFVLYKKVPAYEEVRKLKLAKTKPDKMPKDTAVVKPLDRDTSYLFPNVETIRVSEEGNVFLIKLETSSYKYTPPKKRFRLFRKKDKEIKKSTNGKDLIFFNGATLGFDTIQNVVDYDLSKGGYTLSLIRHWKIDTVDSFHVEVHDLKNGSVKTIFECIESASKPATSYNGSFVAFLHAGDTSKNKIQNLALWSSISDKAITIVDSSSMGMAGWSPSEYRAPYFSENERKLYFGIAEFPYNEPKDTLLDSERFKVDVWNWKDKSLQPQQMITQKFDRMKTYLSVWHIGSRKFVQLATDDVESVYAEDDKEHDYVIGSSSEPYEVSYSWEMPWKRDYYLINEKDGSRKELLKGFGGSVSLSPNAQYALYYERGDSTWHAIETATLEDKVISGQVRGNLTRDNNGSPYQAGEYGYAGWNEDDRAVLLYTEHDVWLVDVSDPDRVKCLTCGLDSNLVFRYMRWDRDEKFIPLNTEIDFYLYNDKTKEMGIARMDPAGEIVTLLQGDFALRSASRAENANKYLLRPMSFTQYPDLIFYNADFSESKRISNANPQQNQYNWGTVDLIRWKSYKGLELEGLLYKPENFDTSKSYPMIVYFYEKYDDQLHAHYIPKPTASIVYPTEYVSNGYIVFIPNVEYSAGHPGKSAYDCILSGTDHLLKKHKWINPEKIGLQGQSWGGYQTAYLVTQTDKYAAAMAGAPVSNMTSAYGGIRWGSGMSRMFQYERTQSRIGATLWDSLDLYIENSPLFFAPQVNTPLLMMHNDGDGAVPWYQGIEYFVALRRLNKPVWLLNYNGDDHNLKQRGNKVDLSIRMRQFFDHYLLDKPAPVWMTQGIPAVDKGRVTGYELEEEQAD